VPPGDGLRSTELDGHMGLRGRIRTDQRKEKSTLCIKDWQMRGKPSRNYHPQDAEEMGVAGERGKKRLNPPLATT